jgi:hypothetical protein
MKYCPNPSCRHTKRHKRAAEFLDHVETCNDCGMAVVPRDELDSEDTRLRVAAFHEQRSNEAREDKEAEDEVRGENANVDLGTGIALVVLGLALFFGPMFIQRADGQTGTFLIAIAPMAYGIYRIERGLSARRLRNARVKAPTGGPYRT